MTELPDFVSFKRRKSSWNNEEDKILTMWVNVHGLNNWTQCSRLLQNKSCKQLRERWMNVLDPNLKKGNWTIAEDYLLFRLYDKLGSGWTNLSKYFPGRTENSIKNRFYSSLRKTALLNCSNEKANAEQIIKLGQKALMVFYEQTYKDKTYVIDSFTNKLSLQDINNISIQSINDLLNELAEDSNKEDIKSLIDLESNKVTNFFENDTRNEKSSVDLNLVEESITKNKVCIDELLYELTKLEELLLQNCVYLN